MTAPALTLNGARANVARLHVPAGGRWLVDVELDGTSVPTGSATVTIGDLTLVGTVATWFSGSFVGVSRVRVVAGAAGWSKVVPQRSYHDDGGVRRAMLLDALAREVGETIETTGDATRLDIDFVRYTTTGARALDRVLGGLPWRVDFDGVTRYGDRPAATLGEGAELLDFDPRAHTMTFAAPSPASVPIGATVTDARMGAPLVVREVEATVTAGAARILAWGVSP